MIDWITFAIIVIGGSLLFGIIVKGVCEMSIEQLMKVTRYDQEVRVIDIESNRVIYAGLLTDAPLEILDVGIDNITAVNDIIYIHI